MSRAPSSWGSGEGADQVWNRDTKPVLFCGLQDLTPSPGSLRQHTGPSYSPPPALYCILEIDRCRSPYWVTPYGRREGILQM